MDFDEILENVGQFGRYQKLVFFFMLLPAVIPCAFHGFAQLFMGASVDHWCRVPELELLDQGLVKNLSIPMELKNGILRYSQCKMYNLNYSDIAKYQNISDAVREGAEVVPCQNGWNFDREIYTSTIVTEWDLVCDKDFLPTFGLVLLGVGGIIGNYIFGYLQDSMGRKSSFFIYLFVQCIFGVATAFAQNYTTWAVFRVGVGLTVPAIMTTPYVLAIELVGPKNRIFCTMLSGMAYAVGLILLTVVVYMVRDWRHLALTTTLPFVCFFLFMWAMPESPRWLLASGQFDKAKVILKKMARINGKSLPANYMVRLHRKYQTDKENQDILKSKTRQYGILDLFKTPNLRKKTILITFIWFTNSSVYVGMSYYAPILGGNEFLNFFFAAIVELPAYLFLWPLINRFGRRWTLCINMVVGGLACLTTFLVQQETNIMLVLYCVGKMGISASIAVLPLMSSELYPTVVRGLGTSLSSLIGLLGPTIIPLVNYLGSDVMVLPLIIMGALLVAGGIAGLLLPETLNRHLPQTLEDGEKIGLVTGICCIPTVRDTLVNKEKKETTDQPACNPPNAVGIMVKLIDNVTPVVDENCEKTKFIKDK